MTTDPLRALQNTSTETYAAALDGHTLIASGSYTDADVPVLALELTGEEPLDIAGTSDDGSFTFQLEVWAAPDGNCILVVTDTGDELDALLDDVDDIVGDVAALLRQATSRALYITRVYFLEYEGQPVLIWEHTS